MENEPVNRARPRPILRSPFSIHAAPQQRDQFVPDPLRAVGLVVEVQIGPCVAHAFQPVRVGRAEQSAVLQAVLLAVAFEVLPVVELQRREKRPFGQVAQYADNPVGGAVDVRGVGSAAVGKRERRPFFERKLRRRDQQIRLLAAQGTRERPLHVLIDVDPEMGRTGVSFADAPELGRFAASFPTLLLDGVQCYAGHLQHIKSYAERAAESTRLMSAGADVFRTLAREIPSCRIYTGTGTGTAPADLEIPELTDIQVGSYCLMDSEYLAVEHGGPAYAPALRLIASVISCHRPGLATIDAGTKALYVTPGAPPRVIEDGMIRTDIAYDWSFGDEHGRLTYPAGKVTFTPGDRVELVVSHCDPTVNLFDDIHAVRGGEIVGRWPISLRGCCR